VTGKPLKESCIWEMKFVRLPVHPQMHLSPENSCPRTVSCVRECLPSNILLSNVKYKIFLLIERRTLFSIPLVAAISEMIFNFYGGYNILANALRFNVLLL